jgi:protein TonB
VPPAPSEPAPPPVSRELRQARAAVAEGRLLASGEDGALALYARSVADAPEDTALAAEVDQVVAEAVAGIAAALDAGRPGEARAARSIVGTYFPAAPGLAGIDRRIAELERDRLLERADELVAAGDAGGALAVLDEAASLLPGRSPGVEARREAILAASENRGRTLLLELGNQRLLQGQLVEPAADNARYYYRAVLAQDSESIAGRQGMAFLRTALITRIREALEAGDRATAEHWLEEARASGVEEARLTPFSEAAERLPRVPVEETPAPAAATPPPAAAANEPSAAADAAQTPTGSAEEAPAMPVTETPVERAEQTTSEPSGSTEPVEATEAASANAPAASGESLADATTTAAEQPSAADETPAQRPAETPAETPTETPTETRTENAGQISADEPQQPAQAADDPVGPAATAAAAAPADQVPFAEASATTDESAPVDELPSTEPASTDIASTSAPSPEPRGEAGEAAAEETPTPTRPERITYVPPEYPRAAEMRGLEGWVDVEFALTADGQPREVEVTDADPAGTFDEAAIDAVRQWRYQSPAETDWPEDELIRIRINFGLDR